MGLMVLLLGVSARMLVPGPASAEALPPIPTCTLRHPAIFFSRLRQMPAVIQADFLARVGTIAPAEEPFDPGDVSPHRYPTHRFMRGVSSRGQYFTWYFIWYERGGRGHGSDVVAYMIGRDGSTREPVAHVMDHMTGNLCAATDAILDGAYSVDPSSAW